MNHQSDFGYSTGAVSMRCIACGSNDLHCCDGHGRRLPFNSWAKAVDAEICRIEGTDRNEITAPYAEMYGDGLSVAAAVNNALA